MRSGISSEGERFSHADFETGSRWSRRLTNRKLFGLNDFCVSCALSKLLTIDSEPFLSLKFHECDWVLTPLKRQLTQVLPDSWMNRSLELDISNESSERVHKNNLNDSIVNRSERFVNQQLIDSLNSEPFSLWRVICYEFGIKHKLVKPNSQWTSYY